MAFKFTAKPRGEPLYSDLRPESERVCVYGQASFGGAADTHSSSDKLYIGHVKLKILVSVPSSAKQSPPNSHLLIAESSKVPQAGFLSVGVSVLPGTKYNTLPRRCPEGSGPAPTHVQNIRGVL